MTDAPDPPGAGSTGDYYNTTFHFHGSEPPPDFMSARNTPPRQVADQQLSRLQQRFARPAGINDAYDTLERHNIVFLYGTPGNGRTTAARVLLRELPRGSGVYQELTPDADGPSTEPLTPELIGEGDRMLLDLSDAKEDVWTRCHDRFPGFHKVLLDKRSFLAVVLPHAHADGLSPDFAAYRKPVNRPDDLEVIARHLRLRGVDPGSLWQAPKELTDYLTEKPPMRELASTADIIVDACRTAKPEDSFADWCRQAMAAREEVHDLVPPLRAGSQRALLLSVAMLHGAPADLIHRAAAILRGSLRIAGDDRPLLEHESLTERLREVGASRNDEARVHFDKLRYDHAVRHFFWRNMPDLRRPLRDWVEQVLALPQFPEEGRKDLVVRLAELCALTEDADRLAEPARDWALRYGDPARLRAAADWLAWGVRHEDEPTSRHFRQAIYSWAIRPVEPDLRRVLTEVCVNVMASTHPEQAVVRLHHLARREPFDEGSAKNSARHVLLRLVEMDTRLRLHLLYRLAFMPRQRRPGRQRALDAWLFLGLLTMPSRPEHIFLQLSSTRLWLSMCWIDVLWGFSSRSWLPHVQRWMTTTDAADDPELVHLALDVLVDAAAENYPALRQIYLTARKSLSAEKTEWLLSRIEEAQRRRPPRRADPEKETRT